MRILRTIVRWMFLTLGFGFGIGSYEIFPMVFRAQPDNRSITAIVLGYLSLSVLAAGLVGIFFYSRSAWVKWTGRVASVMFLPLFPILTPVGILGLIVFWKHNIPEQDRPHAPVAGDGTGKWSVVVFH